MKQVKLIAILFFGVICINCSKTIYYASAEVNYLSGNDGTVTMRAIGVGSDFGRAIANAEQNAFDVLFFRGLPESEQKIALIGSNENEERAKNSKYFDEFYGGRYKTFVMSSVPVSDLAKLKDGQKSISIDVKVNLTALRKDLEQFNIIRKFGF
jgi:hypothetical protein